MAVPLIFITLVPVAERALSEINERGVLLKAQPFAVEPQYMKLNDTIPRISRI